jgi:hypothetical protein
VCEEFAMAKKNDGVRADSEDPITRFAEDLVTAGELIPTITTPILFTGTTFELSGRIPQGR